MASALREYVILGIKTTTCFLTDVVQHPAFLEGKTHTGFIPLHFADWKMPPLEESESRIALLSAAAFSRNAKGGAKVRGGSAALARESASPWVTGGRWRIAGVG
jgi:acetyl/propionyl-CoA carboxylase alpha subunit